jgi:hypothetical protein
MGYLALRRVNTSAMGRNFQMKQSAILQKYLKTVFSKHFLPNLTATLKPERVLKRFSVFHRKQLFLRLIRFREDWQFTIRV